jgi:hypothetical protein
MKRIIELTHDKVVFIFGGEYIMEARLSIQVVPYVTDRGQRKHELRCV